MNQFETLTRQKLRLSKHPRQGSFSFPKTKNMIQLVQLDDHVVEKNKLFFLNFGYRMNHSFHI